jgi:hypothetical protein
VPGQGLPLGIASHCPRPLRGRGRRPQAGWGGGYEEGSTSSAAWGGGETPSPVPTPEAMPTTVPCPGRAGGYSAFTTHAEVGGDDHQNRHGGSTELAPRRSPTRNAVHPCGKFAPMGAGPSPVPTPQGDAHHGPLSGIRHLALPSVQPVSVSPGRMKYLVQRLLCILIPARNAVPHDTFAPMESPPAEKTGGVYPATSYCWEVVFIRAA